MERILEEIYSIIIWCSICIINIGALLFYGAGTYSAVILKYFIWWLIMCHYKILCLIILCFLVIGAGAFGAGAGAFIIIIIIPVISGWWWHIINEHNIEKLIHTLAGVPSPLTL